MKTKEEYYPEKIFNKKYENGNLLYLVKWKDWPKGQSTWEPKENLLENKELIEEFEEEYKQKKNSKDKQKEIDYKTYLNKKRLNPLISVETDPCEVNRDSRINSLLAINGPKILETIPKDAIVKSIIKHRIISSNTYFLVEFKANTYGEQIPNSLLSHKTLKEQHTKELCDYYETKIKFV